MRPRRSTLAAFAAAGGLTFFGPVPAGAQALLPVVSVCGPAPLFLAIAERVVPPNASLDELRKLSASTVEVVQSAQGYGVRVSGTRSVASVARALADARSGSAGSCNTLGPNETRLVDETSLRGSDLAALAAVVRYNKTFRWPLGPVDRNDTTTRITVAAQGPYAYVAVTADFPNTSLGCAAEETYRVDPSTFEVLPFQERCIEANTIPRVLPRLKDLPNTAKGGVTQ